MVENELFHFQSRVAHPSVIIKEARATLELLAEESKTKGLSPNKHCIPTESWQAPPSHWFKLNWDETVDKAKGLIGVGVAVRDSAGQVITTMRTSKHLFPDPLLAEAFRAL